MYFLDESFILFVEINGVEKGCLLEDVSDGSKFK